MGKIAINRNMKRLREEAGLTRIELGKEIGVSNMILRHWESDGVNVPLDKVSAIADFFNVTFDDLLKPKEMKIISSNIAYLRNKNNYTQEVLADKLDITRNRLSSWEEHRCEPNIELIIRIADFFQIKIDDLLKKELRKCM